MNPLEQALFDRAKTNVFSALTSGGFIEDKLIFSDRLFLTEQILWESRQDLFRQAATATKTALANPTTRATYEAEFDAQTKYKSLYGYVLAKEHAKLKS